MSPEKRKKYERYWKSLKGQKLSKERRQKISAGLTGRKLSDEHKQKVRLAATGRVMTSADRAKMSAAKRRFFARGGVHPMQGKNHRADTIAKFKERAVTDAHRENLRRSHLGIRPTLETRKRLSEAHKGAKSYLWKGGITPINLAIRGSFQYREWRKTVFERDDYTCVLCGERGGKLEADHIKPFSQFPDLRFDIRNGRTLCAPCHKNTDTYGSKAKQYSL